MICPHDEPGTSRQPYRFQVILDRERILDGTAIISGYASVFDIVDGQNDVILKGAFKEVVAEGPSEIRFLLQHDFELPIGRLLDINETDIGLRITGVLRGDLEGGQQAYQLIDGRTSCGLSIGYIPEEYTIDEGIRIISKLRLYEISVVTSPANIECRIDKCRKEFWNPHV